ncbi:unnamed protein product, partial [Coregonus sp. 'balchen']
CHLYSINTHHGSELRIVAAIRNKLLLITRKQPRPDGMGTFAAATDSPVDQFQYIRFDLINESTGDAYRLHHVDANRVNFVAAIDVYEDGEAGLLLCYNLCAFPYILAFTTDSIEIRLVVNGNLVYTAVVPELQLTASRSDIYFVSSAPVNSASNCSSRDTSSQSSPQTPTGYEMPVFPSPLGDGKPRIATNHV